eukprot:1141321-Pelagomonas_calceolata.AAC.4
MYVYPRALHEPGALQKLQDFAAGGYLDTVSVHRIHMRNPSVKTHDCWDLQDFAVGGYHDAVVSH